MHVWRARICGIIVARVRTERFSYAYIMYCGGSDTRDAGRINNRNRNLPDAVFSKTRAYNYFRLYEQRFSFIFNVNSIYVQQRAQIH